MGEERWEKREGEAKAKIGELQLGQRTAEPTKNPCNMDRGKVAATEVRDIRKGDRLCSCCSEPRRTPLDGVLGAAVVSWDSGVLHKADRSEALLRVGSCPQNH